MTTEGATFKTIVLGTDFQECSQRAVDMAARLAQENGAQVFLAHTVEIPSFGYPGAELMMVDWLTPLQHAAQQSLDGLAKQLGERGIRARGILGVTGRAWEHILGVAKEAHADLIVVGTHGRGGISHALLGSVAEKVVRLSPVPVLTVRAV